MIINQLSNHYCSIFDSIIPHLIIINSHSCFSPLMWKSAINLYFKPNYFHKGGHSTEDRNGINFKIIITTQHTPSTI